ncbi:MAG: Stp1/IreP family PP2C-type Ser/Thr phosphatase, partial [Pseudomonadota bacterium]
MSETLERPVENALQIQQAGKTDVGIKRDHNEDFLLVKEDIGLFIVCDGMGGHAAGEVASEEAAKAVLAHLQESTNTLQAFARDANQSNRDEVTALLEAAINHANQTVFDIAQNDKEKSGMGTTLALVLISRHGAHVGHVGDSRIYLHRKHEVHQVTEDHSLVNTLVQKGMLSREDAENHPNANVITRAVGVQQFVEPEVVFLDTELNDRFIICSDGLSDYTGKEQLHLFSTSNDVASLPDKLIEFANDSGGKDNITAVVVHIGTDQTPPQRPQDVTASKKMNVLKRVPLFQNLDFKQISILLQAISVKKYKAGEVVVREGDDGDDMYVLLAGEANVSVGDKQVAVLKAGGHFGEMGLIDKSPRSATVKTNTDAVMLNLKRDKLFELLKRYPDLGMKLFWALLRKMNTRLRETDAMILDMVNPAKEVDLG